MITFDNIALYTIDIDYVEYLHSVDSEVYYTPDYSGKYKPYFGVIIGIQKFKYL